MLQRRQEVLLKPQPAEREAEAGRVQRPQDGDHEPAQAGWKCREEKSSADEVGFSGGKAKGGESGVEAGASTPDQLQPSKARHQ